MEQKYITDKQGNKVLPITHVNAVRDDNGNTISSLFGAYKDSINDRLDTQDAEIELLNGSEVIVVADHTAVTSPDSQKIYREQGTTSYIDWMYYDNAWKQIAEYSFPGTDDEPTAGSNNLVKSGGVENSLRKYSYTNNTVSDFSVSDENKNAVLVVGDGNLRTKNFDSRKASMLEDADVSFSISDPSGKNVFIISEDGDIITKRFNSKKLITLSKKEALINSLFGKFTNKKIAILGDSISTFKGYIPPSGISEYDGVSYAWRYDETPYTQEDDVTSVEKTWWWIVANTLGIPLDNINNCSWSGSTVCTTDSVPSSTTETAFAGCSTRRITDLGAKGWNPDIIIIAIGINDFADFGNQIDLGEWSIDDAVPSDGIIQHFRSAYALMVSKIHNFYPSARVFCCTTLNEGMVDVVSGWPADNHRGMSVYEWNENIKEIATAMGCETISLESCGITYENAKSRQYTYDGLHPNAAGMRLIANKVINDLFIKY